MVMKRLSSRPNYVRTQSATAGLLADATHDSETCLVGQPGCTEAVASPMHAIQLQQLHCLTITHIQA